LIHFYKRNYFPDYPNGRNMKTQWWTGGKSLLKLLILIKSLQFTKWVLKPSSPPPRVDVAPGLGPAYDVESGTFHIMSERNVSWSLTPPTGCYKSQLLLLTVSSGPLNRKQRDRWRQHVQGRAEVRLLFLVSQARTREDQARLEEEHKEHGDILQTSLEDGHRKLGYKILTGYVWAYLYCPTTRYVAKTDDNIVLDLDRLTRALARRDTGGRESFLCSNSPSRNIGVGRVSRGHMRGNWSLSKADLEVDVMPDFCSGFLYLTSPKVGAALVQVGLTLYPHTEVRVAEDYLVAGVLRERLPVPLDMIEEGTLTSYLWTDFFSHCPWLTTTKQTFFNDFVVTKNSARSNVQYVGPLTKPQVWRFFLCLHLEAALEIIETRIPGLVPDFVWDVCVR